MISDVLANAVAEMDRYLDSPEWRNTYTGQTRKKLKALRTMMDAARQRLDTPPEQHEIPSQKDANTQLK